MVFILIPNRYALILSFSVTFQPELSLESERLFKSIVFFDPRKLRMPDSMYIVRLRLLSKSFKSYNFLKSPDFTDTEIFCFLGLSVNTDRSTLDSSGLHR